MVLKYFNEKMKGIKIPSSEKLEKKTVRVMFLNSEITTKVKTF